jgi:hypothetical protein
VVATISKNRFLPSLNLRLRFFSDLVFMTFIFQRTSSLSEYYVYKVRLPS